MTVREDTYPSRIEATPQLLDRIDPVVYSTGRPDGETLTEADVERYRRDGFLVMPSLFSNSEVEAIGAELKRMCASQEIQNAEESITEPDSGEVRSIFRIHGLSTVFDKLSRDQRILRAVRWLLDDDVYIHQSRANMKPGFAGKEFYWHSDFETWHVEDGMPRMRAISVSIALTRNYTQNGPLLLIPGSQNKFIACVGKTPENHYKQSLKKQQYGVPDHESLRQLADEGGIVDVTGNPGSVVFFDCNTMHGSNGNITPYPRSNAFFVYNSVTNKLEEPFGGMKPRPEFIAARGNPEILR